MDAAANDMARGTQICDVADVADATAGGSATTAVAIGVDVVDVADATAGGSAPTAVAIGVHGVWRRIGAQEARRYSSSCCRC
jgi:hypothetical protein